MDNIYLQKTQVCPVFRLVMPTNTDTDIENTDIEVADIDISVSFKTLF